MSVAVQDMQRLLKAGQPLLVNSTDSGGRSALHYAVHANKYAAAKFLLENRAYVNAVTRDLVTPLHEAAYHCPKEMVQLLLEHGAQVANSDAAGRLPLHWATDNALGECVSALVRAPGGAGCVNAPDRDGMTPIMYAAFHQRVHIVKKLLDYKADLEEKDRQGNTAMHWAVTPESAVVLRVLLTPDATYFRNFARQTVLHTVAQRGGADAVDVILAMRADAAKDTDGLGQTPLHTAAVHNNVGVLTRLLARGADCTVRDTAGHTVLEAAMQVPAGGAAAAEALLRDAVHGRRPSLTPIASKPSPPPSRINVPEKIPSWEGPLSPHRN